MKKLFKISAVLLIIMHLVTSFAFAAATKVDKRHFSPLKRNLSTRNDIICDDFAMGGEDVTSYGYKTTVGKDSSVSIAKTLNENGTMQNALLLSDRTPGTSSSGAKIVKEIGKFNSGKIGLEIKFKMVIPEGAEEDYATMDFCFLTEKGEKATRFRIARSPSPGAMRWDEKDSGTTHLGYDIQKDVWYKIKLNLDLDAERITGYFESEAFELGSLLFPALDFMDVVQETNDWVITSFSFESTLYTADWYIDYIKIVKDPGVIKREKYYRPEPIQMPVSNVVNNHAVLGKVNVVKDGAYKYFSSINADDEGNVFANVASALNCFGLTIKVDNGKYIGTTDGKEVVINTDGSGMAINGIAMSKTAYKNVDGKLMVSLNEISKAFGYKAEWNAADNTLYITE